MGLLPVLAWLLAFGILQRRFARSLAFGLSGLAAYAWALLSVEGLRFFGQLNGAGLAVSWLLFAAACLALRFAQSVALPRYRMQRSMPERLLIGFAALVGVFVLGIGLLAAPNNWDSMTYHLARVAQWASRGSVAFYETGINRQLSQPPGAEYALLHLYLLSGSSDRLFAGLQGAAGFMAAAAVWRIARALGATRVGASWTLLVLAATPMAVLQASSTQNDLVLAALMAWTLALGLQFLRGRRAIFGVAAVLAASLAIATKGTAWVLFPPLIALLLALAFRQRMQRVLWLLPLGVLLLGLFAGPHVLRNQRAFGSPLGPDYALVNLISQPADVWKGGLSNAAKNTAFALRSPLPALNSLLERTVHGLHGVLGLDVNDGRFHWPASPGFSVLRSGPGQWLHEDYAPNTVLAWLLVAAFASTIGSWLLRRLGFGSGSAARYASAVQQPSAPSGSADGSSLSDRLKTAPARSPGSDPIHAVSMGLYALLLVACWLLFGALLRWQIWHSRLLLPLAVLAAPWLGIWLSRQRFGFRVAAALLLVLGVLPALLANRSRPLIGPDSILTTSREEQYFANRPEVYEGYRQAAEALREHGAQHTLLYLSGDSWEYPLWVLAKPDAPLQSGVLLPNGELALGTPTEVRNGHEGLASDEPSFKWRDASPTYEPSLQGKTALRPEAAPAPTLLLCWKEELLTRDTLILAGRDYHRQGPAPAPGAPGVYVREGSSL